MTVPYRDPEQPPACERCAARDKRIADVRRIARTVATDVALAAVILLMIAHTMLACVACSLASDSGFPVVIVLLTSIVLMLMGNKKIDDSTRRTVFGVWAIVVSLAWAVFVARAP